MDHKPSCQRLWTEAELEQRHVREPLPAQPASLHARSQLSTACASHADSDVSATCFFVCAGAFIWPDDIETLVMCLRRRLLAERREYIRRAAAVVLQRKMLTKFVRRWFVYRELPALISPNTGEPASLPGLTFSGRNLWPCL